MLTWKRYAAVLLAICSLLAIPPLRAVAEGSDPPHTVYLPLATTREEGGPMYTPQQRFGVNVATTFQGIKNFPGSITDYADVQDVGIGWYSDWAMRAAPARPGGMEYAQLVQTGLWPRDKPLENKNRTKLRTIALANPGSLWIIGNEPETRGQGELTPERYADIYHEAYYFLKDVDPTAQIAIGGVVMPTPLRLKWLDRCLDYYQATYGEKMPVDVWNTHMQILREKLGEWGCGIPYGLSETQGRLYNIVDNASVDIFKQLLIEFRTWLAQHGEKDKPLIISEYGVLMPSSYLPGRDQSVLAFMEGTFDYMLNARDPVLGYARDENRLVQRWLWFSLNFPFYDETPNGFNGALYRWDNPNQLTVFGEYYRDYVRRQAFP